MSRKYNVAILGASGNVGRLLLDILEERKFPFDNLKLLASARSAGQTLKSKFGNSYIIEEATDKSFENIDFVLASAGSLISKKFVDVIINAGAVIIDNSSAFRMDKDVPLIVPEVNSAALKLHQGIIANPNCSTAPLVVALKALNDRFGIKRVVVSTYQSISGAGKEAIEELKSTLIKSIAGEDFDNKVINQKLAFNVIPHIDMFLDNGYTKEEVKVINESRKILSLPELKITCTAVRVPVLIGHCESVNIQLKQDVSIEQFKDALDAENSIELHDDTSSNLYPMPINAEGKDSTFIGRIRKDESAVNAFNFWLASDNLRKGAALNTIQIAEEMIKLDCV